MFFWQRVGANAQIAERECSMGCGTIAKGTSVTGAVGAESGDFQCHAVLAHPGDGPADDCYPYHLVILHCPQTEFMPMDGAMMPVMKRDEGVGFIEF